MGRDPRARRGNQGLVAAVSTLKNAVAAMSMLVNPNTRERSPHYLRTSVEDVGKQDKKGQICKALESICRNCRIKGHYEKVCMKKATHLVDVPCSSSDASPIYFDELREPVYVQTYTVQVNGINI